MGVDSSLEAEQVVAEEGEGDEEDAVGDGRMSTFRLRLVSIYRLAPTLQPLLPPRREGGPAKRS